MCCVEASTRGSYPCTVCFFIFFLLHPLWNFPGGYGLEIRLGYGATTTLGGKPWKWGRGMASILPRRRKGGYFNMIPTRNHHQAHVHGKGNPLPYCPLLQHQTPPEAKRKRMSRIQQHSPAHTAYIHTYRASSPHPLTSNTWNRHAHTQHTTSLPAVPPPSPPALADRPDFDYIRDSRTPFCTGGVCFVLPEEDVTRDSSGGTDEGRGGTVRRGGWLGYVCILCVWEEGGHGDDGREVFSPPPAPILLYGVCG